MQALCLRAQSVRPVISAHNYIFHDYKGYLRQNVRFLILSEQKKGRIQKHVIFAHRWYRTTRTLCNRPSKKKKLFGVDSLREYFLISNYFTKCQVIRHCGTYAVKISACCVMRKLQQKTYKLLVFSNISELQQLWKEGRKD